MQTLDQNLQHLVDTGKIAPEIAKEAAVNQETF